MNFGYPIATGNTATIYENENKVIKVYKEQFSNEVSILEAQKQVYAYSYGLPVPKIIEVTEIEGKQAIVMERIPGETLGELVKRDLDLATHYMNLSVEVQRNVHSFPSPKLELMTDKLKKQIQSAEILENVQKTALIHQLESMDFEPYLCHGDFHLLNLILSDETVYILDWIDATSGDIRADVYRSYLLYAQHSEELAELYLHLYGEKSGTSKDEIFQWAAIIAAARLSENVQTDNKERLLKIIHQQYPRQL
ncbi:phosphotransferase [Fictibacillus nanhaiensis]|uniref:Phosphotransferase n=2 Tax=Fictibacillus nanhaiensis TaxID=742169 RepID=A0ABS2ZNT5_9BACL|nr:phosphotransferase [Fictibacillus nanhaiensis]